MDLALDLRYVNVKNLCPQIVIGRYELPTQLLSPLLPVIFFVIKTNLSQPPWANPSSVLPQLSFQAIFKTQQPTCWFLSACQSSNHLSSTSSSVFQFWVSSRASLTHKAPCYNQNDAGSIRDTTIGNQCRKTFNLYQNIMHKN